MPAQAHGRDLDRDLVGHLVPKIRAAHAGQRAQLVAHALGELPQGELVRVPAQHHRDGRSLPAVIVDLDALHRLRQVAQGLGACPHAADERLDVVILLDLHADATTAVHRTRFDVLDTAQIVDRLLDRDADALLDLRGPGAGVGRRDTHPGGGETRIGLLVDAQEAQDAAQEDDRHEQVGGDRVGREPGEERA